MIVQKERKVTLSLSDIECQWLSDLLEISRAQIQKARQAGQTPNSSGTLIGRDTHEYFMSQLFDALS